MDKRLKLFGTAGIRGLYGTKVTAELVFEVSQAVTKLYPSKGIIVGHDARTSSESLSQCARAAVSLSGGKVFFAGLCTFPVIANLTLDNNHTVAIYITASHNPPQDNGIKVLRNGREFTKEEQNQIEELIELNRNEGKFIRHEQWDHLIPQKEIEDANERYIKRILKDLDFKGDGRKVILDCANGPMSNLAPILLTQFGFQAVTINSHIDGHFPGRLAEPSPQNLSVLIGLCKKEKTLGVAFDGDGDRIALVNEKGEFVELSRTNALLATFAIEEHGPGKIILSIDSSTTIDKAVQGLGGIIVRTQLGELHGKAKEIIENKEKVVFAAEPWKPIFPNWGLWIDGLYAFSKLLKVIIRRKTTVSEIMESIPRHIAERKASLVNEERAAIIYEKCQQTLKEFMEKEEKKVLTIDGLRYDLKDGTWILIRKSGTEPKIRIYYESPTPERFDWIENIVKQIESIIKNEGN
ncbi:MAG: phosphoglucosamine mutase [Candidatus Thorarchaeota archaeon]